MPANAFTLGQEFTLGAEALLEEALALYSRELVRANHSGQRTQKSGVKCL